MSNMIMTPELHVNKHFQQTGQLTRLPVKQKQGKRNERFSQI